jgi:hypothetical protein
LVDWVRPRIGTLAVRVYQGRKLEMYASKPAATTTHSRAVTLNASDPAMSDPPP